MSCLRIFHVHHLSRQIWIFVPCVSPVNVVKGKVEIVLDKKKTGVNWSSLGKPLKHHQQMHLTKSVGKWLKHTPILVHCCLLVSHGINNKSTKETKSICVQQWRRRSTNQATSEENTRQTEARAASCTISLVHRGSGNSMEAQERSLQAITET